MPLNNITTCLWFDGCAEEAANHYISIFSNSRITSIQRYTAAGKEHHGHEPGSVMIVEFELNGHKFVGLNGGPQFKFTEAVSFMIHCKDQEEVDWYWEKLGEGREGDCGWIKDKFGLSWQIVPNQLKKMLSCEDAEKSKRAMEKMLTMGKMDIEGLEKAFDGQEQ
ncbi:3-demethylubiquinone-9 3-methyltransferase [Lindgomyces ingoldianus]|uniref:3-demethylubiquinone-9 3-methyltransferase n=1 Tax=Lindgomyces ingoldianus TaxID=673940 RepID=A0ACB6R5Z5_9PLEO|nr:3-demethylubiquinone-9 3-methyltransferase [Lindgomyces ingoldianus]KAF2473735.1 3-demethylubiquinone-9 3-methyltransferase [Lindgomyces ingoldianus]